MVDTKKLEQMRTSRAALKAKIDQAKGRCDVLREQLKSEYGCGSLADAKKKLQQFKSDRDKLAAEIETAISEFDSEWAEILQKLREGPRG